MTNRNLKLRSGDIVQITDQNGLTEYRVLADSGEQFNVAYVIPTPGGEATWIEKVKIVAVRSE